MLLPFGRIDRKDRLPPFTGSESGISRLIPRVAFDPSTGLPAKLMYESVHVAGAGQPVEETFSDFREVSGIKAPFHISIAQSGNKFAEVTIESLQINTGLKPEELAKRP